MINVINVINFLSLSHTGCAVIIYGSMEGIMTANIGIFCSCGSTLCPNFEGAREAGKGASYSTRVVTRYTSRIKPSRVVFAGEIKEPLVNPVNPIRRQELYPPGWRILFARKRG
jgi:hypothetical protein